MNNFYNLGFERCSSISIRAILFDGTAVTDACGNLRMIKITVFFFSFIKKTGRMLSLIIFVI